MTHSLSVLGGTVRFPSSPFASIAFAQTACVTQNMVVPPGANTTDKAAPFFIDTTGLDFKTKPPTRDPRARTIRARPSCPTGRCRRPAPRAISSSGRRTTPRPRPSRRKACRKGTTVSFTLSSKDSTIYNPGLIRDDVAGCGNSSIMIDHDGAGRQVEHDRDHQPSRHLDAHDRGLRAAEYAPGTEAPFIVIGDGGSTAWKDLNTTLDNLIQQRRVPPMVAIQIGNGGQDAQGAQRGREYDTVSGTYAQFVEREVLPLVEQNAGVKLTKNPEGRATMGLSSSGIAAFTMAWFHPELYRRVLAFSPTMVNQQWPWDPALRGGAWEYHSAWTGPATPNLTVKAGVLTPSEPPGAPLIPSAPTKPIRYWFEMGDQDLFYPNPTIPDGMHDWTLSAALMAKVLADKGYHYQFLFARNAKHVDRPTVAQTLPSALEWVWKGYPIP